jgi:predicted lipid-binding transport protein (Tim44 family)
MLHSRPSGSGCPGGESIMPSRAVELASARTDKQRYPRGFRLECRFTHKEKSRMKRLFLSLFAVFLSLSLPMHDAEAKRFGGGKSFGMQRDSMSKRDAAPQRNADGQQNASGAPQQNAAGAAGKRSWLGPVAGLAAGLGLAALASHLGLGEEFANILLIALLAMGGFLLYRYLTRGRPAAKPQGMQYAGMGAGGGMPPLSAGPLPSASGTPQAPGATPAPAPAGAATALPADFDAEGFARQAKLNFLRLQAAYDAGNLDDIREFTSPEMYAEIKLQLDERGAVEQRTDVVNLDAEVLECAEEPGRYVVSVRFHGLIREDGDAPARDFDEIWHLSKPANAKHGWVVAGIQQVN